MEACTAVHYGPTIAKLSVINLLLHTKECLGNCLTCRLGLGAPRTGFMLERNCDPLPAIVRKCVHSLRQRLISSDNQIICTIVGSSFCIDSQITKEWTKTLYAITPNN